MDKIIRRHGGRVWAESKREGDEFHIAPWNELVIYELHVGTFNDQTDDDLAARFESVSERLGHLKKLGVNAIQIKPVGEFSGDRSWGYNPAHIFSVEVSYGGPLVFSAPGIPMLFQGQEFLEGDWFRDTVPLDWDPDDFIKICASKSYISGKPYLIKFSDGKTMTTGKFLRETLKGYQATPK